MTIEIEREIVFPGTTIHLRSKDRFAQVVDVIKGREGDKVIVTRANIGRNDGERNRAFRYKKNLRTVDKGVLLNPSRYGLPGMIFVERPYMPGERPGDWVSVHDERYQSVRVDAHGVRQELYIYLDRRDGARGRTFVTFGRGFVDGGQPYAYPADWREGIEFVCVSAYEWLPIIRRLIRDGAVAHLLSLCAYLDETELAKIKHNEDSVLRAWYGVEASKLYEGDVLEVDWSRWKPTAAGDA